jgi:hypothetical protein
LQTFQQHRRVSHSQTKASRQERCHRQSCLPKRTDQWTRIYSQIMRSEMPSRQGARKKKLIRAMDYKCDDFWFSLSAQHCQVRPPTSQNLNLEREIWVAGITNMLFMHPEKANS